jgi:hypothetical protein
MVNLSLCCTGTWHASERKASGSHIYKRPEIAELFSVAAKESGSVKNGLSVRQELETIQQWRIKGKKIPFTVIAIFFSDACCMMMDGVWERHSMRQCATAMVNVKA